eukprot:14382-Heterococcus_DN1.PRE.8
MYANAAQLRKEAAYERSSQLKMFLRFALTFLRQAKLTTSHATASLNSGQCGVNESMMLSINKIRRVTFV